MPGGLGITKELLFSIAPGRAGSYMTLSSLPFAGLKKGFLTSSHNCVFKEACPPRHNPGKPGKTVAKQAKIKNIVFIAA